MSTQTARDESSAAQIRRVNFIVKDEDANAFHLPSCYCDGWEPFQVSYAPSGKIGYVGVEVWIKKAAT